MFTQQLTPPAGSCSRRCPGQDAWIDGNRFWGGDETEGSVGVIMGESLSFSVA